MIASGDTISPAARADLESRIARAAEFRSGRPQPNLVVAKPPPTAFGAIVLSSGPRFKRRWKP